MRSARVILDRVGPEPPPDHFARAGDATFQVCRASVDVDDHAVRVAMFWPADGESTSISFSALTGAILREAPDVVPAVVRSSGQQTMEVETPATAPWQLFGVAATAAAARVSWAWDDSPIAVTVNNQPITIDASFADRAWLAVEIRDRAV